MCPGRLVEGSAFVPFRAPSSLDGGSAGDAFAEEQRRIQEMEKAAFEQGLERARKQAREEVERELGSRLEQLKKAIAQVSGLESSVLGSLRDEIALLVLTACGRMLHERLERDDPVVLRAVDELLAERANSTMWEARVHPKDFEVLSETMGAGSLTLVPDESVSRGGVLLESRGESVDARIETVLREVTAALRDPA